MKTEEFLSEGWDCSACGQTNNVETKFCTKCGKEKDSVKQKKEGEKNSKKKSKKLAIAISGIVLLVLIAGGIFLGYDYKQKKDAKNFVSAESANFAKSIEAINSLATENLEIEEEIGVDDSMDVIIRELEEEKSKTEEAIARTTFAATENDKRGSNKIVAGLDAIMDKYNSEAEKLLAEYKDYIIYDITMLNKYKVFETEMDKIANSFATVTSIDDLKKSLSASRDILNQSVEKFKEVRPVSGLEEYHKKVNNRFEKMATIIGKMLVAIEEDSVVKMEQALSELDEFINSESDHEDDLKYFTRKLHEKFTELGKTADKTKEEFVVNKTRLKADMVEIIIEPW